ncbi:MAG: type II toxin-antitoxin system VapC family toxin [Chthoniobacterales bacterium]
MIVADCSIIARLIIGIGETGAVDALWVRDNHWAVPTLWEAEFASVLLKYERAGQLSPTAADGHALRASTLLRRATHFLPIQRVMETARRTTCSSYDSYYVALAEDLQVPLYTFDRAIAKKCPDTAFEP